MSAIDTLLKAIGYPPGEISAGERQAVLRVDSSDVKVRTDGGRLIFEKVLCHPEEGSGTLARLAGYAAGRMLKEEAVLAWNPSESELILWQDIPENVSPDLMRRVFEVFMTSCDWWMARINDSEEETYSFPEMVILP